MIFEQNKIFESLGERTGFVAAYFVFTTILFLIFIVLKRLPSSWTYFHIMAITLIITLIGLGVKRLLK